MRKLLVMLIHTIPMQGRNFVSKTTVNLKLIYTAQCNYTCETNVNANYQRGNFNMWLSEFV